MQTERRKVNSGPRATERVLFSPQTSTQRAQREQRNVSRFYHVVHASNSNTRSQRRRDGDTLASRCGQIHGRITQASVRVNPSRPGNRFVSFESRVKTILIVANRLCVRHVSGCTVGLTALCAITLEHSGCWYAFRCDVSLRVFDYHCPKKKKKKTVSINSSDGSIRKSAEPTLDPRT